MTAQAMAKAAAGGGRISDSIDRKIIAGAGELDRLLDDGDPVTIELVKAFGRDLPDHLEAFWLGATALDRISWTTIARPQRRTFNLSSDPHSNRSNT